MVEVVRIVNKGYDPRVYGNVRMGLKVRGQGLWGNEVRQ